MMSASHGVRGNAKAASMHVVELLISMQAHPSIRPASCTFVGRQVCQDSAVYPCPVVRCALLRCPVQYCPSQAATTHPLVVCAFLLLLLSLSMPAAAVAAADIAAALAMAAKLSASLGAAAMVCVFRVLRTDASAGKQSSTHCWCPRGGGGVLLMTLPAATGCLHPIATCCLAAGMHACINTMQAVVGCVMHLGTTNRIQPLILLFCWPAGAAVHMSCIPCCSHTCCQAVIH
jgi:hypothetical protein